VVGWGLGVGVQGIPASICGCPCIEIKETAPSGFCELSKDECVEHVQWQSVWKHELAKEQYVQSRRLQILKEEIETVITRIRDRETQLQKVGAAFLMLCA
jgi:hypothetical protein